LNRWKDLKPANLQLPSGGKSWTASEEKDNLARAASRARSKAKRILKKTGRKTKKAAKSAKEAAASAKRSVKRSTCHLKRR
jgi:hypothetical protein